MFPSTNWGWNESFVNKSLNIEQNVFEGIMSVMEFMKKSHDAISMLLYYLGCSLPVSACTFFSEHLNISHRDTRDTCARKMRRSWNEKPGDREAIA